MASRGGVSACGQSTKIVEAKREAFPRDVRQAVWQLRNHLTHQTHAEREVVPFFVARAISPGARDILREEKIGFYDLGGTLYIPAPNTFVYIDRPVPPKDSKAFGAIFQGQRARVVQEIFARRPDWVSVKQIAEDAEVLPATASDTLSEMERREWVEVEGAGPSKLRRLRAPKLVLDAWADFLTEQKPPKFERYYVSSANAEELARKLDQACNEADAAYAVTSEAAAQAYAGLARLDYRMALPVPDGLSLVEAAGIMEVFVTAHEALMHLADLQPGEWALIHAASGGVGSAAVQLAKARGARVIFTAGGDRIEKVKAIGGDVGVDFTTQDFAEVVAQTTEGKGVNVIVDFIGAPNLERNVRSLDFGGRLVQVGIMGGIENAKLPLDLVLYRHLKIIGTVMKSRDQAVKHAMVRRFGDAWLGHFGSGALKPVIDSTFPMMDASKGHSRMETGATFGKIILTNS